MPVLTKDDKNILFIHIPKTAGTTVENVFKDNGYSWSYRTRAVDTLNKVTVCTPQHMHAALLEQNFKIEKFDYIFTILRCPYARIQSEYAMRTKDPGKIKKEFVNAWLERKFKQYVKNSYVNDNHIRPQHEFIVQGTDIYKLEDELKNIFSHISKKNEVELIYDEMGREMSSVKRHGYSSSDVELDQTAIDMINDFYALDFYLFGYEKR